MISNMGTLKCKYISSLILMVYITTFHGIRKRNSFLYVCECKILHCYRNAQHKDM